MNDKQIPEKTDGCNGSSKEGQRKGSGEDETGAITPHLHPHLSLQRDLFLRETLTTSTSLSDLAMYPLMLPKALP